jgi:glycosyltransferase involved in cell wall biosynthesis
MPRLAIVASHPIQYHAPWFRALARVVDLRVFYAHRQDGRGQAAAGFGQEFDWDVPLLDGYEYEWLPNVATTPDVDVFAGCDTPAIAERLATGRFDACLVSGWYLKSYVQAMRTSLAMKLPLLMRGDSHLLTPRPWLVAIAKYLPYRWMLRRITAHLYVGRANREYLEHYGVRRRQLFFAPHFVENDRFAATAEEARRNGLQQAIRGECGVAADTTMFVFAGKLIEKKRPADFIEAVAQVQASGEPVHGLIVGSGPLEFALRTRARQLRAPITFAGFKNQTAIPAYYAAGDCLILPSDGRETWGLVANEAMACGLPIITSHLVGCARDLAVGDAGATYPMGDVAALASLMREYSQRRRAGDPAMTQAALHQISQYTCDAAVQGTLQALEFAGALRKSAPVRFSSPASDSAPPRAAAQHD